MCVFALFNQQKMALVSVTAFSIILLWYHFPSLIGSSQVDEYCSENLYHDSIESPLAKEFSFREYGIVGSSKSVYCCARNYESVQWLKNGREYPWLESSFTLTNTAINQNQTLHANRLTKDDSGTYTCNVRTKSGSYYDSYSFNLTVFDSRTGYTDTPLSTYVPPETKEVHIGRGLRLYCEAFVGKIDLPDAKTEIMWYKEISNSSFSSGNGIHVNKVIRDRGLTIGLYLMIDKLDGRASGNYTCHISNAGDQKIDVTTRVFIIDQENVTLLFERVPLTVLYPLCLIIFLALIIYCLCAQYGQEVYIYVRQHAKRDKYDGIKDYDIFLLYEVNDEDFVTEILIPALQQKYGYVVCSQLFEKNSALTMECQSKIASSRSILVVWSSLSPTPNSTDKIFLQKLQFITTLHKRVVCIVIEDTPILKSYLKKGILNSLKPIDFVKWATDGSNEKINCRTWRQLWSSLPPKLDNKKRCDSSDKLYTSVDGRRVSRADV